MSKWYNLKVSEGTFATLLCTNCTFLSYHIDHIYHIHMTVKASYDFYKRYDWGNIFDVVKVSVPNH